MTKLFKLSLVSLLLTASMSFAQTIVPHTTLGAAVANSSTTTIQLTSATGVTGTSTAIFIADGEGEAMFVNSVSGNVLSVTRGYQSLGKARAHLTGALVFIFSGQAMPFMNVTQPSGSCTRTNEPYLPVVSLGNVGMASVISDCIGGVWVNGLNTAQNNTQFELPFPNTGGTVYTSIGGTGTTLAATTMYCTEIDLPYNKLVTGIALLNGTTVGTDNHLVALYDATGNLLANSAVAGVLAATASNYQKIALTTSYYAVGPAVYYGCFQTNGTTATVRTIQTQTQDTYLTKGVTGQTFGTLANFTAPTTFSTAVGGYLFVY